MGCSVYVFFYTYIARMQDYSLYRKRRSSSSYCFLIRSSSWSTRRNIGGIIALTNGRIESQATGTRLFHYDKIMIIIIELLINSSINWNVSSLLGGTGRCQHRCSSCSMISDRGTVHLDWDTRTVCRWHNWEHWTANRIVQWSDWTLNHQGMSTSNRIKSRIKYNRTNI